LRVFGLARPGVVSEQVESGARPVGTDPLRGRFERSGERRRVARRAQEIELERTGGNAAWIFAERAPYGVQRTGAVRIRCGCFSDPEPQRRRELPVCARIELALREARHGRRVPRDFGRDEASVGEGRIPGQLPERAIEELDGRRERAGSAVRLRGAQPCVGGVRLGPPARGEARSVAARWILERFQDERRLRLEAPGFERAVAHRARDDFGPTQSQVLGVAVDRGRKVEGVGRALVVPVGRAELREVQEQERLPLGDLREGRPVSECALSELPVPRREPTKLECEPHRRVVGRFFRGLLEQGPRAFGVGLVVLDEERLIEERTGALVRGRSDLHQTIEELAEIFERLPPLDDRDQALERLGELRLGVDGGELVTGRRGLVAEGLLEHADLVEEHGLACGGGARGLLGAQARHSRHYHRRVLT